MEKTTFNHVMSIDFANFAHQRALRNFPSWQQNGWAEQSQSYLRKRVIWDFFPDTFPVGNMCLEQTQKPTDPRRVEARRV